MKAKLKITIASLMGVITFLSVEVYADCPTAHCTTYGENVDRICTDTAKAQGKAKSEVVATIGIITDGGMEVCTCPCSCFAAETRISTPEGDRFVEEILDGDQVFTSAGTGEVDYDFLSTVTNEGVVAISLSNGRELVVTADHPVIRADGLVVPAEDLTVEDILVDAQNNPVRIVNLKSQQYTGKMYNFALNGRDESGLDRILISEGIQTGDWHIQAFRSRLNKNVNLRTLIIETK